MLHSGCFSRRMTFTPIFLTMKHKRLCLWVWELVIEPWKFSDLRNWYDIAIEFWKKKKKTSQLAQPTPPLNMQLTPPACYWPVEHHCKHWKEGRRKRRNFATSTRRPRPLPGQFINLVSTYCTLTPLHTHKHARKMKLVHQLWTNRESGEATHSFSFASFTIFKMNNNKERSGWTFRATSSTANHLQDYVIDP